MALMSINEEEDWSIHGDSKQGISVRQGNNIIILPPDVVAKIRTKK